MEKSSVRRLLVALSGGAFAVVVPGRALATPNFPPEIETHLMLDYLPDCSLCHQGTQNINTVTTPFGLSIKAAGLEGHPNDTAALDLALDKLEADMTDSDKDGTPDIEELKAGTDPNMAGGGSVSGGATIAYGCFNQIAGGAGAPWAGAAFTALGLACAMRRRRR